MNIDNIKTIYFTGIKGVGMTSLACIAKDYGIAVTGSDIEEVFVTDEILAKKNILVQTGFSKENIKNVDLLIYSAGHQGADNIEVVTAKQQNIPTITFGEALGLFFNTKAIGISIAGVGGKTSTSAMLATVFESAQQNPSYMIGVGEIPSLPLSGKYNNRGSVFISEADEYACSPTNHNPKFYYQNPKIIILTNLAFDHPDIYTDKQHTLHTFQDFAEKLPHDGVLIANYDSLMVRELVELLRNSDQFEGQIITYGQDLQSDWQLLDYKIQNQQATFRLDNADDQKFEFKLDVPGIYNAHNAIATIITSLHLGLSVEQIQTGLLKFTGTKRRFEKIGEQDSNLFYDDYAHHPDEIKATLKAARQWFGDKKIITIFQPHTFSRTKALFDQFVDSFTDSDQTIILDIFPSAREPFDDSITSEMLVHAISSSHSHQNINYAQDFVRVMDLLQLDNLQNTIVITMGAGNVYKLWEKI